MKLFLYIFLFAFGSLSAQQIINGKITDRHNVPIAGANIYIEGTYEGTTSTADGTFSFETSQKGQKTLIISYVSYVPFRRQMEISQMKDLEISLREDVQALDAVVLSAGTFSAGDNSKVSVLKPLDVVTTAGVAGDFIAALQTLPGTQTVGEDGRLFVRGGTAEETQIYIDGLRVFQPYTASPNNLPSRGRYSPFLFDGITFSTGGYSAEYGQALSSVLLLNTINEPDQSKTDVSIMTVGAGLGHTQKWEKSSLSFSANYINLAPYLELVSNNETAEFTEPFQTFSGESVFRKQFQNGLFKAYAAYDQTEFEVLQPDINNDQPVRFNLKNRNLYSNLSYAGSLGNGWSIHPGLSLSGSSNDVKINLDKVENTENAAHFKLKVGKRFDNRFKLNFGAEHLVQNFSESYRETTGENYHLEVNPVISAAFTEADLVFTKRFAAKVGIRGSFLQMNNELQISPRLSLAYKLNRHGQVSFAYGEFFQQPQINYLKYDAALQSENATHYILNYQWTKPGYTFRAEAFYKKYDDLVTFDSEEALYASEFQNEGLGYAGGLDLFFRDNKTFKNLEYWASYSFIDSERKFRNFPKQATPNFIATHSASLVTKYWINELRSQVGFTYNFSSGRPYENPNSEGFLNEQTGNYNSLSFNWAYLLSRQKILYFSVSNITGAKNIFGYEYAENPSSSGIFERRAITQAADRFFFVGFFWTISADKKSNQLDNL
ncbi:TonB-dependent receptor [Salinimicrobium sp. GXAS 041]|uniref:TonB-dependent receptor n=1 Tax=Salinimicrobium sp. GXAS 041 TaxID=3400806 RepID=UPI003C769D9D